MTRSEMTCFVAEGLWMGIMLIVFNSLGLAALWCGRRIRHKCLFIAYFVCSIIGCVVLAALFITSIMYSIGAGAYVRWR